MDRKQKSPSLSGLQIFLSFLMVVILVVPIVLIQTHGDVDWVQKLLGEWRIVVFVGVGFVTLHLVERAIRKKSDDDG